MNIKCIGHTVAVYNSDGIYIKCKFPKSILIIDAYRNSAIGYIHLIQIYARPLHEIQFNDFPISNERIDGFVVVSFEVSSVNIRMHVCVCFGSFFTLFVVEIEK